MGGHVLLFFLGLFDISAYGEEEYLPKLFRERLFGKGLRIISILRFIFISFPHNEMYVTIDYHVLLKVVIFGSYKFKMCKLSFFRRLVEKSGAVKIMCSVVSSSHKTIGVFWESNPKMTDRTCTVDERLIVSKYINVDPIKAKNKKGDKSKPVTKLA